MNGPIAHIDLGAVVANWRMLAARAPSAQAAAVVKADAYGLGASAVARALHAAGCQRFYVAWPAEGANLRRTLGAGPEIAVFNGPGADHALLRDHALEPVLNSLPDVHNWLASGGDPSRASLHVDTGMSRLGLAAADLAEAAALCPRPRRLLSHLACADEPDHVLNARQLAAFAAASAHWPGVARSFSSTGGVYLGPDYAFDEIRPGIGLYGGGPTPETGPAPLPVLRLTAHVLQVRDVAEGETVGYGATWTSPRAGRIAIIGLGYADGFLRSGSARGRAFIGGEARPIAGRISMDLIAIDITGLTVAPGDEVEIVGPNIPLADQAEHLGQIDYEFLTRLGSRITRSYAGAA